MRSIFFESLDQIKLESIDAKYKPLFWWNTFFSNCLMEYEDDSIIEFASWNTEMISSGQALHESTASKLFGLD